MKQHRFSERLVELRTAKNLSQYALAKQLGFTRGQIANYEQGTRKPDYTTLIKLADFFAVSIDYLLGRTTPTSFTDQKGQNNRPAIKSECSQLVDELLQRPDLQSLLEEARKLSHNSVQRIIRYIRLIEEANGKKE